MKLRAALAAFTAALVLGAASARAEGDGLYGRFDGDLELQAAAGAALSAGGPMLAARAAARYLCTAGVYLHYADAVGTRGPRVARSFAAGLEIAPLFLARYASDLERGPARLDLLLDSIALGVGAFWDEPRSGPFGARPGLEIALDLAVPILDRATGPFLGVRGALRWRDGDLAGARGDVIDRGALLSFTLGWHHVVRTHLVDPGDAVPR